MRLFLILAVLPPTVLLSVMVSPLTFLKDVYSLVVLIHAASIRREAVCYLQGVNSCLQHGAAGLGDLSRASLVCRASSAADKIRPEQQQQERTVRACARATGVFNVHKTAHQHLLLHV